MITSTKKIALICLLVAFAQFVQAQVKVGDNPTEINKGSILELESANKGLLFPRVSLTNTTTWSLAASSTPVAGMISINLTSGQMPQKS
ncbi:hypothetical protein [Pedobacter frigiditerrae]|uniref:hypothetical protein n=1 Tax=Pedobacter frigiditerrae TaxID=2530452 RepID=UPI00292F5D98|nr:hypothetical protein [Pedobacter frigiditerrae]